MTNDQSRNRPGISSLFHFVFRSALVGWVWTQLSRNDESRLGRQNAGSRPSLRWKSGDREVIDGLFPRRAEGEGFEPSRLVDKATSLAARPGNAVSGSLPLRTNPSGPPGSRTPIPGMRSRSLSVRPTARRSRTHKHATRPRESSRVESNHCRPGVDREPCRWTTGRSRTHEIPGPGVEPGGRPYERQWRTRAPGSNL